MQTYPLPYSTNCTASNISPGPPAQSRQLRPRARPRRHGGAPHPMSSGGAPRISTASDPRISTASDPRISTASDPPHHLHRIRSPGNAPTDHVPPLIRPPSPTDECSHGRGPPVIRPPSPTDECSHGRGLPFFPRTRAPTDAACIFPVTPPNGGNAPTGAPSDTPACIFPVTPPNGGNAPTDEGSQ